MLTCTHSNDATHSFRYHDCSAPVLDGIELAEPLQQLARTGVPDIPVLAGANLDEGTMFIGDTPPLDMCTATADDVVQWSTTLYGAELGPEVMAYYQNVMPGYAVPGTCPKGIDPDATHKRKEKGPPRGRRLRVEFMLTCTYSDDVILYTIIGMSPSIHWAGAMRSVGDAAILCRARELLAAARKQGAPAWWYLFTATPIASVNVRDKLPPSTSFLLTREH